jgi:hypothetical protein
MSTIPLKASVGSAEALSAVPTRRDVGTGFRVGFASLSPPYEGAGFS